MTLLLGHPEGAAPDDDCEDCGTQWCGATCGRHARPDEPAPEVRCITCNDDPTACWCDEPDPEDWTDFTDMQFSESTMPLAVSVSAAAPIDLLAGTLRTELSYTCRREDTPRVGDIIQVRQDGQQQAAIVTRVEHSQLDPTSMVYAQLATNNEVIQQTRREAAVEALTATEALQRANVPRLMIVGVESGMRNEVPYCHARAMVQGFTGGVDLQLTYDEGRWLHQHGGELPVQAPDRFTVRINDEQSITVWDGQRWNLLRLEEQLQVPSRMFMARESSFGTLPAGEPQNILQAMTELLTPALASMLVPQPSVRNGLCPTCSGTGSGQEQGHGVCSLCGGSGNVNPVYPQALPQPDNAVDEVGNPVPYNVCCNACYGAGEHNPGTNDGNCMQCGGLGWLTQEQWERLQHSRIETGLPPLQRYYPPAYVAVRIAASEQLQPRVGRLNDGSTWARAHNHAESAHGGWALLMNTVWHTDTENLLGKMGMVVGQQLFDATCHLPELFSVEDVQAVQYATRYGHINYKCTHPAFKANDRMLYFYLYNEHQQLYRRIMIYGVHYPQFNEDCGDPMYNQRGYLFGRWDKQEDLPKQGRRIKLHE